MFEAQLNQAVDILNHYPGPIMIACAAVGTGVITIAALRWMDRRKPRDNEDEMKRKAMLDQMYADKFGDALFDMLMRGEITRHEYRRDCKRFGIGYRLYDLIVKKNPKRGMKYRVTKNCSESHATPSPAGKIPGPKPGEDCKVVALHIKPTRKVWVVARRKTA